MKKSNYVLWLLIMVTTIILISCNASKKGKWTASDIEKFRTEMEGVEELNNLGEDKSKWIECYLRKCEATFSSFTEADNDKQGCERIALECNNEVFSNGSVKGKWSESDKQKFRADMETIEELSDLGDNKTKWIECYLSKCEANFASYYEADTDQPGCEKLALECNEEIE